MEILLYLSRLTMIKTVLGFNIDILILKYLQIHEVIILQQCKCMHVYTLSWVSYEIEISNTSV